MSHTVLWTSPCQWLSGNPSKRRNFVYMHLLLSSRGSRTRPWGFSWGRERRSSAYCPSSGRRAPAFSRGLRGSHRGALSFNLSAIGRTPNRQVAPTPADADPLPEEGSRLWQPLHAQGRSSRSTRSWRTGPRGWTTAPFPCRPRSPKSSEPRAPSLFWRESMVQNRSRSACFLSVGSALHPDQGQGAQGRVHPDWRPHQSAGHRPGTRQCGGSG